MTEKQMKQQTARKILFTLPGGIVCVLLLFWSLKSFNTSQNEYWEAEIDNEGSGLEMTLRLMGSDSSSQSRQIIFKDLEASGIKSGTFKLPDEADQMSGTRLTFQDITLRPGRVTLELYGHQIDIMGRDISIDGVSYDWDQPAPIEIVD